MTRARDWDILGIGDAAVDLYIRVGRLPGRDEKTLGEYVGEFPGGMISNVCCAASVFGARTAMACVMGDDRYGALAVAGLRNLGVDTSQVRFREGSHTFFCVIFLDDSGEKALIGVQTGLIVPRQEDIDLDALGRARLVHVICNDLDRATWVAQQARSRGTLVSVDLEPVSTALGMEPLHRLLRWVDIVFMNEAGSHERMGVDAGEVARWILDSGPKIGVVTAGSDGCVVGSAGDIFRIPAFQVPVLDSTGAGDCFNGVFLTCYLKGWDVATCSRYASAAAAISVTQVGARSGLPSAGEVEAFLATYPHRPA